MCDIPSWITTSEGMAVLYVTNKDAKENDCISRLRSRAEKAEAEIARLQERCEDVEELAKMMCYLIYVSPEKYTADEWWEVCPKHDKERWRVKATKLRDHLTKKGE